MRSIRLFRASLVAIATASSVLAQIPSETRPRLTQSAPTIAPISPAVLNGGAPLDKADVGAWLDGFMPFALARGNIAGAVVVVVKDGKVLVEKGYGYANVANRQPVDPETTLFRPGSVSKLFTWTAVMQLVEQGKLNLDADINTYLDFKVPEYEGKPITLRNIMTHTSGFEETARYLIGTPGKPEIPLNNFVRMSLPKRIYAPGSTPAYSNYATTLAGYIVQRVSGQPFDNYTDQHIFQPIGMLHSTFRQPLPPALKPFMANGYEVASGEPKPYEIVNPAPAGSLATTGADMARFMIAHLDQGRGLLRPETAQLMHDTKLTMLPPLNRMALGFYEQNVNGHRVIAHGGDTQWFHSDLSLFLDDHVGLFVSMNSPGAAGAVGPLRSALFEEFANRYYPAPLDSRRVGATISKQHAQMMAGTYADSRGHKSVFFSILGLFGQSKLGVDNAGRLSAAGVTGYAHQPRKWVEITPFVWRDVNSAERLAAKLENGRAVRWSVDAESPFIVFDRVPWYLDSAWLLPTSWVALAIVLLTAVAWPARALTRRRYRAALAYQRTRLQAHRSTSGLAWAVLLTIVGWAAFLLTGSANLALFGGALDWLLWSLQIVSPIAFFGLAGFALWTTWLVWSGEHGWFARLWSVLLAVSAFVLLWVALGFHLIGFGTRF